MDSFNHFHEKVVQCVMVNYNKGRNIVPIIKLINDVDSDKWATDNPKEDVKEMQVKRYELKYKLYMEHFNTLDDNKCKFY